MLLVGKSLTRPDRESIVKYHIPRTPPLLRSIPNRNDALPCDVASSFPIRECRPSQYRSKVKLESPGRAASWEFSHCRSHRRRLQASNSTFPLPLGVASEMKLFGYAASLRWTLAFAGLAMGSTFAGCTPEGQGKVTAKGKPPAAVMKNLEDPAPSSGEAPKRKSSAPGRSIKERIAQ